MAITQLEQTGWAGVKVEPTNLGTTGIGCGSFSAENFNYIGNELLTISTNNATESNYGRVFFATNAQVILKEGDGVIRASSLQTLIPDATTTVMGLGQYATAEDIINKVDNRMVAASMLPSNASTSTAGVVTLATTIDGTGVPTAAMVKQALPTDGSTITKGVIRFASNTEAEAGVSIDSAITPYQLLTYGSGGTTTTTTVEAPWATNTVRGIAKFATNTEAEAGTSEFDTVNPFQLQTEINRVVDAKIALAIAALPVGVAALSGCAIQMYPEDENFLPSTRKLYAKCGTNEWHIGDQFDNSATSYDMYARIK